MNKIIKRRPRPIRDSSSDDEEEDYHEFVTVTPGDLAKKYGGKGIEASYFDRKDIFDGAVPNRDEPEMDVTPMTNLIECMHAYGQGGMKKVREIVESVKTKTLSDSFYRYNTTFPAERYSDAYLKLKANVDEEINLEFKVEGVAGEYRCRKCGNETVIVRSVQKCRADEATTITKNCAQCGSPNLEDLS